MPPLRKNQDGDAEAFIAKVTGFGSNDMCLMQTLTMDSILANLKKRFVAEIVYTNVGDIVVSLNPFKNVGAVGARIRDAYKQSSHLSLPPHIYALVHQTYGSMMSTYHSQSILISGESGAGKTEAMKICLTFMGELSAAGMGNADGTSCSSGVATQLLQTNPVMEAIGNAKTVRNNNSSRFGKHFDVQFDADGRILGAFTSVYLLEKPRICEHMAGERNYHVFYMLCKASGELRAPIHLANWQSYRACLQKGTVAEVTSWNDEAEFKDMHAALLGLGFSEAQRTELYLLCASKRAISIQPWPHPGPSVPRAQVLCAFVCGCVRGGCPARWFDFRCATRLDGPASLQPGVCGAGQRWARLHNS